MEGQEPSAVFIDHESFVVQQVVKLLEEKWRYYFLRARLTYWCAARAQIHATEGGQQVDGGVRADIISKLMTAQGILQLRQALKDGGKRLQKLSLFSFHTILQRVVLLLALRFMSTKKML